MLYDLSGIWDLKTIFHETKGISLTYFTFSLFVCFVFFLFFISWMSVWHKLNWNRGYRIEQLHVHISIFRRSPRARLFCICARIGYLPGLILARVNILYEHIYRRVSPADFYGKWKYAHAVVQFYILGFNLIYVRRTFMK